MKYIRRLSGFTAATALAAPIFVILFLGALMARGQVRAEFDTYKNIREFSDVASLTQVQPEALIMVRGKLAAPQVQRPDGLVVFRERPLAGRETRFQEAFPLVFPAFTLELADGRIAVSAGEKQVIAHEAHRVTDTARDREYTGFRAGDTVTVQGVWSGGRGLTLASGISGQGRDDIMTEGQSAFERLDQMCAVLAGLSAFTLVLLGIQALRLRRESAPMPAAEDLQFGQP